MRMNRSYLLILKVETRMLQNSFHAPSPFVPDARPLGCGGTSGLITVGYVGAVLCEWIIIAHG